MSQLRDHLQRSLGSTYTFERELEGGGMSRVFVAEERALGRPVVVKVLAPDLAVAINRERFKREILFAARLQHPHIIPVLSAGELDDLPYYTMPYVDGLSLRDRLDERRPIPIDEIVHILRDIADALAYAHDRGIVHRDIKPDNVLLAGGHALVTDFGVAKALSAAGTSREDATISRPGITAGTPAYMAPEQAAGDPRLDDRADIYAFGIVAYELLTGERPFAHATAHELVLAHLREPPPAVSDKRPDIPLALAQLVMRCLEKEVRARPQSANELLDALEVIATGHPRPRPRARPRWGIAAAWMAFAVVVAIAWRLLDARVNALDSDLIAVLPFRVAAADAPLRPLREGMLDLLDAKFVTTARTVDPRALLAAWRGAGGTDSTDVDERTAVRLARRFGAGQLLAGSVSGGGRTVVLTAALRDIRRGTTRRATVQGGQDSVLVLVDRLVAQLLALRTGQDARSIASLGDKPLETLREYITAQALSRRGRFEDATPHFRNAIARDSTFALAGIGLALNIGWLDAGDANEGWRIAWRGRERLSPADRAILEAWVGRSYPRVPGKQELRALAEHATRVARPKAEAWYALGDNLYHFGALQGLEHAPERALTALDAGFALDSSFAHLAQHLPDLYLRIGDTVSARRAMEHLLALDSTSRYGTFNLWFAGVALGDHSRHERAMASLERALSSAMSVDLAQSALVTGAGYDDAEYLLERVMRQGATEDERTLATLWLYQLAGARGRPSYAARLFDRATSLPPTTIVAALFEEGDSATAARARSMAAGALAPDSVMAQCTKAELAAAYDLLARHSPATAASLIKTIDARFPTAVGDAASECAVAVATLRVLLAPRNVASLSPVAQQLDLLLRSAPPGPLLTLMVGNLVAMRAFIQLGDMERALNAARRRPILYGPLSGWAPMLREEARLAALTGDRDGAIHAYRLFIGLRAAAEPTLQAEVRHARAELARLERESSRR